MELDVVMPQKVKVKSIRIYAKLRDEGSYTLLDAEKKTVAHLEDEYVPNTVVPGEYGDYLDLDIDLETGVVLNWKKPSATAVAKAFGLLKDEE